MAKEYVVIKDGAELKTYKSLPAAKALAEKEGAEVVCEGECVYSAVSDPATIPTVEEKEQEVESEKQVAAENQPQASPEKYTLTRKMNVRKAPSLKADKVKVLDAGAEVEVTDVVDDWLHLTDGTFILFEGGKNARKN